MTPTATIKQVAAGIAALGRAAGAASAQEAHRRSISVPPRSAMETGTSSQLSLGTCMVWSTGHIAMF